MIEAPSMTRVSKRFIPSIPTLCPITKCVYNSSGVCDDPQCNKGNSDAACHLYSNRNVLRILTRIDAE